PMSFDLERFPQSAENLLGEHARRLFVGDGRKKNRELIASQPRDGVDRAQGTLQARAELTKDRVSHLVSERVVDLLETVEVEKTEWERNPFALGHQQSLVEPVAEKNSVGKSCQKIIKSLPLERFQVSHPLADVPKHRDPVGRPRDAGRNRSQ